jgi:N4-gp56 family major capsid protein
MTYTPGGVLTGVTTGLTNPTLDKTVGDLLVTKAHELSVWGELRANLIFDQLATVRATRQSHRGASVEFKFVNDLAPAVTPLTENLDVASVSFTTAAVEVALAQYGNAVTNTDLLAGTSMVPFDPVAAERIAWNARESIDYLARAALRAGTPTLTVGAGTGGLTSLLLRQAVARLKTNNVRPLAGGNYAAVISPKMESDLKAEADAAGWRWVVGSNPGAGNSIYNGEVGTYEGCRIIVNNSLGPDDAGDGYVMGAEALAKAFSTAPGFGPNPRVVISPMVDKLERFRSLGWKHLVGYKVFRSEAYCKIHVAAS